MEKEDKNPHYLKIVGRNITLFRKERELTRKELSALCGVKESKLVAIERGSTSLLLTDLMKIAKALDVNFMTLTK